MAGHSKWANIKHRKAAQDAKRGKIFTKLIRELTVAARQGGADADSNPRLRTALDKALSNNMKRDTIDKAVARGSGDLDGENYEEVRYEGYAANGVAVMVDCLTDNRQRTVSDVRHAFSKHGGNLGTDGSVAYLFNHIGMIVFENDNHEDQILEVALENGADDVVNEEGVVTVITDHTNYLNVKKALHAVQLESSFSELTMAANMKAELSEEDAQKVMTLVDVLEDLDDVQSVYTNLNG